MIIIISTELLSYILSKLVCYESKIQK